MLEPVDVPVNGKNFLHTARFALLHLRNWNLFLVPTVVAIRTEVVGLPTNAKKNVIVDGRTLNEVRADIVDPVPVGRRLPNRLAYYDSWSAYFAEMNSPDKCADILFMYGFSTFYNVSLHQLIFMINIKYIT